MSTAVAPPLEFTHRVRDDCVCLHVQRAARALARRFDKAFRPLGLTQGQFSVLTALNRTEPPTMGDVAKLLAMDRTTLTANLKPLEVRDLIRIAIDKKDRRGRRLSLTDKGKAMLGAAAPVWTRTHVEAEKLLTAIAVGDLRAGLRALS